MDGFDRGADVTYTDSDGSKKTYKVLSYSGDKVTVQDSDGRTLTFDARLLRVKKWLEHHHHHH
uniref:De novo designed small beta-barrel protein 33_bp_sh3 n=1 Tax=synthetic construct TaxID=32630 RepID=UPI0023E47A02|nr:Chain A, De novo designed small beta-barrel protein 33_bp_sh3 [synthetic construct]